MAKKKYSLTVFGCQMNERDAETLRGFLLELDYEQTAEAENADLVIINTCAVRQKAEEKVFGQIGRLGKLKKARPEMMIAICGCMVQQEAVARKLVKKHPFIDLIFGTHNISVFPALLQRASESSEPLLDLWDEAGEVVEGLPVSRKDGIRAWVNISYGCDNFCAYCIVPYVRGRERSRHPAEIMAEISNLASLGYQEVTLLGQNVNSYGKDLVEQIDFSDLLQRIDREGGINRLRFMTSHPRDWHEKLARVIGEGTNICEHVHLPIQSGSNRILALMNRGYTREHYLHQVEILRRYVPNCAITTDLIVGFPGETEADFLATLDIVEQVSYDAAFTFLYSQRSGTPAAKMAAQISSEVKKERFQRLLEIQNRHSLRHNQLLIGKTVEVLVEGSSKTNPDVLSGRTRGGKTVNFAGEGVLAGDLLQVEISEAKTWSLSGRISVENRNTNDQAVQGD
ncbi:MAG: tRNA (N6-isopentenyl adenosine(37)-C2)-methylthiotransferase MiaB [Firmicutes bacterium]|jgi:tRNA-2-methylthio-N6-dimethylallyladenosine synthase|nr:tRNA (N6-isopentenyl adenosine(37)-C2)-methylthiotransferase MiaB [Dethiobacter sp.]MCL4462480.1 tRNA (N6-isopentenyl adenosine(37)-C2)-methylthiotransferase MiaB [Bacillota bacterium]MCL5993721.1 tRNA (N6-isopentenyl adenosine(37)-C2)-methylthiotransferase MiaB [Bacillota bacterium]